MIQTKVEMYRGMLIGHSFVSGFADHFANKNGGVALLPHDIAAELRVQHFTPEFHLVGGRGGRLSDPDYFLPEIELLAAQPHFVILNMGANDLVSLLTPFEQLAVAEKVVGLARELNARFNVSVTLICIIIDRFEGLRVITPQQFHEQLFHVNNMVMNFCQSEHYIKYYVTKGFWQNPPEQWTWDGMHPNKPVGRETYKKAIRRAIFQAIEHLSKNALVLHTQGMAPLLAYGH